MTGRAGPAWNWLSSVAVPVLWAAAEMTWIFLWMAVVANASPSFGVDIPYALFAVPAMVAAGASGVCRRYGWAWWRRSATVAPVVLVGAAITAGLTSELAVTGSFGRAAFAPWTTAGHPPASTAAALGWVVAILVWARGTGLGTVDASFAHVMRSMGLSFGAFVLLFTAMASSDDLALHRGTGSAGLLFVFFCPAAAAVLAVVHERDLERKVLLRATSRPSLAWVAVLAVPMLAVTGGALLLVQIGALAAPAIRWAVAPATNPIGSVIDGITAAIRRVFSQQPTGWYQMHLHPATPRYTTPPQPSPQSLDLSTDPPVVAWVLAAVGLLGIVVAAPLLAPRWFRRYPSAAVDEELSSVFSWQRLAEQMRRRLAWRRSGGGDGPPVAAASLSPVRLAYRDLLSAARSVQLGRHPAETADEFEHRIAHLVDDNGSAAPLSLLTEAYRHARYGIDPLLESDERAAREAAETVITALGCRASQPR